MLRRHLSTAHGLSVVSMSSNSPTPHGKYREYAAVTTACAAARWRSMVAAGSVQMASATARASASERRQYSRRLPA
jgi:hypothetical protein